MVYTTEKRTKRDTTLCHFSPPAMPPTPLGLMGTVLDGVRMDTPTMTSRGLDIALESLEDCFSFVEGLTCVRVWRV
jgi:hypothetical protein